MEIQLAIVLIKYDGLWPTHGGGKSRGYRGDVYLLRNDILYIIIEAYIYHNKSNTLKLLDKIIVQNNLLTRSKVRPAKYGSSIAYYYYFKTVSK